MITGCRCWCPGRWRPGTCCRTPAVACRRCRSSAGCGAVAVPQLDLGAVAGRGVRYVDAPAGLAAHDLLPGAAAAGRGGGGGLGGGVLPNWVKKFQTAPESRSASRRRCSRRWAGVVAGAVEGGPDDGVTGAASGVGGDDVGEAALGVRAGSAGCSRCCGRRCRAGPARRDGQHVVPDAVETDVGDGLGAAAAAAEVRAGVDGDGAEDGRPGAGEGVGHRAAVAEAGGEDLCGVDAEAVLDGPEHVVDEGDVLTAGVGPAVVDALGGDEDRVVAGLLPQAVVGPVVAVGAARVDVVGGAAHPVEAEDQPVGGGCCRSRRGPAGCSCGSGRRSDRVGTAGQRGGLAAARGRRGVCGRAGQRGRAARACLRRPTATVPSAASHRWRGLVGWAFVTMLVPRWERGRTAGGGVRREHSDSTDRRAPGERRSVGASAGGAGLGAEARARPRVARCSFTTRLH